MQKYIFPFSHPVEAYPISDNLYKSGYLIPTV